MAENKSAWGIEIGQAGLKAIKLRYAENAEQVVAVAYDYVAHPKLLNQPDAVPDDLIRQALETFLSRNPIGSDLVAISLPGQNALAKFIQLPPVEQSKVAEIVKYEARQQIPFPLEEVIWDFQALGGGIEESGYLLDGEVGLFAMKREQVQHHLQPFLEKKVEVELIQIAPLSLYNFLCYDRLGYRNDQPRESNDEYSVVVDMGSDATTLIVTNGKKIWIRNMPVGGNHFTRALTKEMKLTFAKAEHLKCNATKSPDPRAVFQALRPVFNDYVAEIQRSIGFFSSVNRSAKISRLIGVGNGFRLAGLQKFLQQNLQYEVERVDTFKSLVGDHVLNAPLFQENLLTFCVPYGLALQCLKLTDIHTNLLPPEIVTERKIRRKKPWAVATAATLMLGLATSAAGFGNVLSSVSVAQFGEAEKEAQKIEEEKNALQGKYDAAKGKNKDLETSGKALITTLDTREDWLEVYKAIDESLPRDLDNNRDELSIPKMERISIRGITSKKYDELGTWFSDTKIFTESAKGYLREDSDGSTPPPEPPPAAPPEPGAPPVSEFKTSAPVANVIKVPGYEVKDKTVAPSGPGYVFTLEGVHYHHIEGAQHLDEQGAQYVANKFLKNLQDWVVVPETKSGGQASYVPVRIIGISHATIIDATPSEKVFFTPAVPGGNQLAGGPGNFNPMPRQPNIIGQQPLRQPGNRPNQGKVDSMAQEQTLHRTTFKIAFAWKPTLPSERKAWPPVASANPDATAASQ